MRHGRGYALERSSGNFIQMSSHSVPSVLLWAVFKNLSGNLAQMSSDICAICAALSSVFGNFTLFQCLCCFFQRALLALKNCILLRSSRPSHAQEIFFGLSSSWNDRVSRGPSPVSKCSSALFHPEHKALQRPHRCSLRSQSCNSLAERRKDECGQNSVGPGRSLILPFLSSFCISAKKILHAL